MISDAKLRILVALHNIGVSADHAADMTPKELGFCSTVDPEEWIAKLLERVQGEVCRRVGRAYHATRWKDGDGE